MKKRTTKGIGPTLFEKYHTEPDAIVTARVKFAPGSCMRIPLGFKTRSSILIKKAEGEEMTVTGIVTDVCSLTDLSDVVLVEEITDKS